MNEDLRALLIQAMMGGGAPMRHLSPNSALSKAMLGRARINPRWASLPALPPYGEARHADGLNGAGSEDVPAFQPDAFQNDAFQVS